MYNLLATTWSSVTGHKTAEWNGNSVPHNTLCQSGFTPWKATCWGWQYSTGDISLLHHFNPETEQHSTNWHIAIPSNKKADKCPQLVKLCFLDYWGPHTAWFFAQRQTMNATIYIYLDASETDMHCQKCLMKGLILQHNRVRPHRAQWMSGSNWEVGWEVLPQHPYSL